MSSDRWNEINRLYTEAIEVEENSRASFLEESCGADTELRREVESLLAYDRQAQQLLDGSALELAAEKLAGELPSLIGRKLGPYQIEEVLGVGGMGEVYRARDTRLNRTVAIKVLPRHLSERPELRQRFEREARAIAGLNHPNICSLHDIGKQDGVDFLVMEYIDGETLSQRLKRGPLATEEVLRYSIQIAGALDKAHRQEVIHRDLKPGNIMLTETGAMLLDFGLAKRSVAAIYDRPEGRFGDHQGPDSALTERRYNTQTESLTEEGVLLGTLEYMAPEQLEGKEADPRTDIFALGVVIYEMATGQKAFEGASRASVIAKILTAEPPSMTAIQPVTPLELDRLVRRCLAKNPEERWQNAGEINTQLREIADTVLPRLKVHLGGREPGVVPNEITSKTYPRMLEEPRDFLSRLVGSRARMLAIVGIVLALIVVGSLALRQVWKQRLTTQEQTKEISFKPLTSYSWDNIVDHAAISADGKYLAFCMQGELFVQVVRSGEKRSFPLPEGFKAGSVVWFPDGTRLLVGRWETRWVELKGQKVMQGGRSLWVLSMLGGAPQKIEDWACESSVSPDGSLVAFTRSIPDPERSEIWLVGANGENPRRVLVSFQPNVGFENPIWSSNGQRLFYYRDVDGTRSIESCDLRGEEITTVFTGQKSDAPWEDMATICLAPEGRLLFFRGGIGPQSRWTYPLWEIKVESATGQPLSQARQITQFSSFSSLSMGELSITGDGKHLLLLKWSSQGDVFVAEAENGGKSMKNIRRLTLVEADDEMSDWTADSRAVLFMSNRNGNADIFKQNIDRKEAEAIVTSPEEERCARLSPDGAFVLYLVSKKPGDPATRLMRIPVGGGPPQLVLSGEKIKSFSCAREAKLCVVAEEVEGKQMLTTFDPLKGRGEKLPQSDYPNFGLAGILSPQGRLVDKMKSGPEGLYVHVSSLTGGPVQEITFKNLTAAEDFRGWSLDGKGIYVWEPLPSGFTVYYAGLDGHIQVLWKRGMSPQRDIDNPFPSPDGRHFAFTSVSCESNAWLLENF